MTCMRGLRAEGHSLSAVVVGQRPARTMARPFNGGTGAIHAGGDRAAAIAKKPDSFNALVRL
jgi:hypothetical protein